MGQPPRGYDAYYHGWQLDMSGEGLWLAAGYVWGGPIWLAMYPACNLGAAAQACSLIVPH